MRVRLIDWLTSRNENHPISCRCLEPIFRRVSTIICLIWLAVSDLYGGMMLLLTMDQRRYISSWSELNWCCMHHSTAHRYREKVMKTSESEFHTACESSLDCQSSTRALAGRQTRTGNISSISICFRRRLKRYLLRATHPSASGSSLLSAMHRICSDLNGVLWLGCATKVGAVCH